MLLQMAFAMRAYEDEHGRMPPAVVYGADGRALYSWRVLVLPYLDQKDLYDQFKLDEPWDSPANGKLLPAMPYLYAPPPGKVNRVPPYHTICQVLVGRGAAFEGTLGLKSKDEFADGTSNTLLIVEAGAPVPWTKPQDLVYDPDGLLPKLRGFFDDGFRAVTAATSRRWISYDISKAHLRGLITRNGRDEPGPPW
jgi:hypothetical protein